MPQNSNVPVDFDIVLPKQRKSQHIDNVQNDQLDTTDADGPIYERATEDVLVEVVG